MEEKRYMVRRGSEGTKEEGVGDRARVSEWN